ncbi:hypothetical protein [Pseudomonas sp. Irchel s3h17]|uniref:hypothetical protein n=1 Tax=Pseudomonas sp. Irchel s3h17 TaxID=2009182 RepID=UPI000BA39AD4|nr:hypothetical protein [Pseudomonas sp. Irchel s3h17]
MQSQQLIIIAACSAVGLLLMAYFVRQAVLRAVAKGVAAQSKYHRERVAALTKDIIRLSQTPKVESILTRADYQTLLQAHATLILAQMTWRAMPGTESTQLKAEKQAQRLLDLANRISTTAKPGSAA